VEEVGGKARSVLCADVATRGRRAPVKETEVISMGLVEPKMRNAETRIEKIGREAGAPEAIVRLQELRRY
jgi:hypothetical protein